MKWFIKLNMTLIVFYLMMTCAWAQNGAPVITNTSAMPAISMPVVNTAPLPAVVVSVPPSVLATPVATAILEKPLTLGGKFGIGTDSIRIDENSFIPENLLTSLSLVSLNITYWLSDVSALDVLVTANPSSNPGSDFNGNPQNYIDTTWGAGLGYRCNLYSPVRNLKLQGLVRVTYAQFVNIQDELQYQTAIADHVQENYAESFYLTAGLGFEYFMPFCDALSVQGNVTYAASYNDGWQSVTYNPNDTGATNYFLKYSYFRTAFNTTGLSLSAVSVHYYF